MRQRTAAGLRDAHDTVLGGGADPRISPGLHAAWERAIALGIDPERQRPVRVREVRDTIDARQAHVLAPYVPVVSDLLGDSSISDDHLVVITDITGEVLWRIGSNHALGQAESIEFVEGADWSESGIGTNAISEALVTGAYSELVAGEHLVRSHHDWMCSAAPVRNPFSGEMVAVLDVSAPTRLQPTATGAIVRMAARMIEEMMRADAVRGEAVRPSESGLGVWVRLLGHRQPTATVAGERHVLTPRRAELLALLASRRQGWTADELAHGLYGEAGVPASVRAEMHRLRSVLGDALESGPYRLAESVSVDLRSVLNALQHNDIGAAIRLYPGPLLPGANALTIGLLRAELDESMRRAIRASGDLALIARWVDSDAGRTDLDAIRTLRDRLPDGTAQVRYAARLGRLDLEFGEA